LTVLRTTSEIIDALGAMDQVHEMEVSVNADWGYYDNNGVAQPLSTTAPFTEEVYESCLRAYIEGILIILTSPVYGLVNYDARNQTPTDFAVGLDDTGQTVIQQTVRATILVHQRRGIAR
jgi:hypothetical protein